jgi:redox-sensitive bicupin YhaK (pirin superfamily)
MGKVRFVKNAEANRVYPPDGRGSSRMFHNGGQDELQLFEVNLEPGMVAESHAHEQAEIIYVLKGSLHFGATVLTPGDSVQIDGMTLYAFEAGPEGVSFINFRPRPDMTFYKRDEFVEYQKISDPKAKAEMREHLIEVRKKEFGYAD